MLKHKSKSFKFLKNNKRGIELTINFIVMLILGIAMLSGAIMLTTKLFGKAKAYQTQIDANTQAEIKKLITSSNDLVVIYPARKTMGRKESATFGVGVQNTLKQAAEEYFTIDVAFARSYYTDKTKQCDSGNENTCASPSGWLKLGNSQKIKRNEVKSFPVIIATKGNPKAAVYVFDVRVCQGQMDSSVCNSKADNDLYDQTVHKIYVNVE
ncbi:TPA: hypothetical protein HA246_03530 [Candidatus Woesearchaeota archaeon]|nr:hypothetical protein [Candidatus Woesearchaeota archaeon]